LSSFIRKKKFIPETGIFSEPGNAGLIDGRWRRSVIDRKIKVDFLNRKDMCCNLFHIPLTTGDRASGVIFSPYLSKRLFATAYVSLFFTSSIYKNKRVAIFLIPEKRRKWSLNDFRYKWSPKKILLITRFFKIHSTYLFLQKKIIIWYYWIKFIILYRLFMILTRFKWVFCGILKVIYSIATYTMWFRNSCNLIEWMNYT